MFFSILFWCIPCCISSIFITSIYFSISTSRVIFVIDNRTISSISFSRSFSSIFTTTSISNGFFRRWFIGSRGIFRCCLFRWLFRFGFRFITTCIIGIIRNRFISSSNFSTIGVIFIISDWFIRRCFGFFSGCFFFW